MQLDDRALPLTRGQLDIWLAHEAGHSGPEWQLGLFARVEGAIDRDALQRAICQVVREAEPVRAAIFEEHGQVFQRTIDYPDIELACYDLSSARRPVQEARDTAASIQRTPMPFTGPLFKFALFQTWDDEFYVFACGHHIVIDGIGIALVGNRLATVYSALVSGTPIPPTFFGSLQDLIRCELEYEASDDYLEDQDYWTKTFQVKKIRASGHCNPEMSVTRTNLLRRFGSTLSCCAVFKSYPRPGTSRSHRSSPRRPRCWCIGGAVRGQRWCSTSRSADECARSRRGFPEWSPAWCRWY